MKQTYGTAGSYGHRFVRNVKAQEQPCVNINKLTTENKAMLCTVEYLLARNVT